MVWKFDTVFESDVFGAAVSTYWLRGVQLLLHQASSLAVEHHACASNRLKF